MTPTTRTALTALLALLSISVLVCPALPVAAQTPAPAPTIVATPPPPTPTPDPEVVALRAQLELMERYDQRLLETVYWALGGMLTVVAVVIGAAWLFNWQYAQREKQALLSDLRSEVQAGAKQVELSLQAELEREFGKVRQATKAITDAASRSMNSALGSVQGDVEMLKYDLLNLQADSWQQQDVPENVLRTRAEMLSIALKLESAPDSMYLVPETLGQMRNVLKNVLKKEAIFVEAELAAYVDRLLDRLPPNYHVEATAIRELLARARARS